MGPGSNGGQGAGGSSEPGSASDSGEPMDAETRAKELARRKEEAKRKRRKKKRTGSSLVSSCFQGKNSNYEIAYQNSDYNAIQSNCYLLLLPYFLSEI